MDSLRGAIKEAGLAPDNRINHWKNGVPQNPDTWAYKVYHFHLDNRPCSMNQLCRGIGVPTNRSHKVALIINQLRKAGTWNWAKRPDREQAEIDQMKTAAGRYGEEFKII